MAFCLGRLRLAPAAFWALTPREIAALLPSPIAGAPDRAALVALMAAHPDTTSEA
jgi:uncharacterized phage protein (TIGR02216 family)